MYFIFITMLFLTCSFLSASEVEYIAFVSDRSGSRQIYIISPSGGNEKAIFNFFDVAIEPVWSPLGGVIAFTGIREGRSDIYLSEYPFEKWKQLTPKNLGFARSPQWSFDGTKIIFTVDTGKTNAIYAINPDGTNPAKLIEAGTLEHPSLSPDNTLLLFDDIIDNQREIYLYNLTSQTELQNLSEIWADDIQPRWSPKGDKIAFTTSRDGDYEIYFMNPLGKEQKNITNDPYYNDKDPAWKADGEWLTFCSDRDGDYEIFIMDKDGKHQKALTFNVFQDTQPSWGKVTLQDEESK